MLVSVLGAAKGMDSVSQSNDAVVYAFVQHDQFDRPKVFQSSQITEVSTEASSSANRGTFSCDGTDHPERDIFIVDTVDAINYATAAMHSRKRSNGSLELSEAYLESGTFVDEMLPRFDVTSPSSYNPYSLISSCDDGKCHR